MNTNQKFQIKDIQEILKLETELIKIELQIQNKKELFEFVDKVLLETKYIYKNTKRKDKNMVRDFLLKVTKLSDRQLSRLILRKRTEGRIKTKYERCHKFRKKYTDEDVSLLVKTDNLHMRRNGHATKENLAREFNIYGNNTFKHISEISVSHIYNLRNQSKVYERGSLTYTKTMKVSTNIGERKKPQNYGIPGHLRVDSVHQGDKDGEKGVYFINIIDEVTQWEFVACVQAISEFYLYPILLQLIDKFPFRIINFHSDNGSEYVNHSVSNMLKKLCIEQTKSRSGRCNDNALVEGKNYSVIRKSMGYHHIPKHNAEMINDFMRTYNDDYLNYHRICSYPTITINEFGKRTRIYENHNTPFRKFISIDNYELYLKPNLNKEELFAIERRMSDNEYAEILQKEKQKLFNKIHRKKSGV